METHNRQAFTTTQQDSPAGPTIYHNLSSLHSSHVTRNETSNHTTNGSQVWTVNSISKHHKTVNPYRASIARHIFVWFPRMQSQHCSTHLRLGHHGPVDYLRRAGDGCVRPVRSSRNSAAWTNFSRLTSQLPRPTVVALFTEPYGGVMVTWPRPGSPTRSHRVGLWWTLTGSGHSRSIARERIPIRISYNANYVTRSKLLRFNTAMFFIILGCRLLYPNAS